jgi:small subunit ribosomal protein S9
MGVIHKIGRRKPLLHVLCFEGTGVITVNKKELTYFPTATLQYKVMQPMSMTENATNFDVKVNVYGGGSTGQAEAVRMALARVMCEVNAENRLILKPEGLLTRDPRMVERKNSVRRKLVRNFLLETLILPVLNICIQD